MDIDDDKIDDRTWALRQWGIPPASDGERLDLSHYPEDSLSSGWCRLMNRPENVG